MSPKPAAQLLRISTNDLSLLFLWAETLQVFYVPLFGVFAHKLEKVTEPLSLGTN